MGELRREKRMGALFSKKRMGALEDRKQDGCTFGELLDGCTNFEEFGWAHNLRNSDGRIIFRFLDGCRSKFYLPRGSRRVSGY